MQTCNRVWRESIQVDDNPPVPLDTLCQCIRPAGHADACECACTPHWELRWEGGNLVRQLALVEVLV